LYLLVNVYVEVEICLLIRIGV